LVIEAERSCVLPDSVRGKVSGVISTLRGCKNRGVGRRQVRLDEIHQVLVDQAGWYLIARGASALEPARHRQRISTGVALEGIPQSARAGRPSRKRIVDLGVQSTQIPAQFRRSRDVQQGLVVSYAPVALIARVEPALWGSLAEAAGEKRPANHSAKLVLLVRSGL